MHLHTFRVGLVRKEGAPPTNGRAYAYLGYNAACANGCYGHYKRDHGAPHCQLDGTLGGVTKNFFGVSGNFKHALLRLLCHPKCVVESFVNNGHMRCFHPFRALFVLTTLCVVTIRLMSPRTLDGGRGARGARRASGRRVVTTGRGLAGGVRGACDGRRGQTLTVAVGDLRGDLGGLRRGGSSASTARISRRGDSSNSLVSRFMGSASRIKSELRGILRGSPFLVGM